VARQYEVQRGDSLSKVAQEFYNDASLFRKLAEYNGIRDPRLILVGQVLEIPSKRELIGEEPQPPAENLGLLPPHGLEGILSTFGNPQHYLRTDGTLSARWEAERLGRTRLPFAIPLSWDHTRVMRNLRCHSELRRIFAAVFREIESRNLHSRIRTFGGCYNFRTKRSGGKLSTHCWGIAIDLNPETNRMGSLGDMHPDVIEVFREHGFKWGGDWPGRSKDPMHFQFCTGY